MRLPSIFIGHGSPMIALEDNKLTDNFRALGDFIIKTYGKPKAILSISAHWFTRLSLVQAEDTPRQIYDMYVFPDELYELRYPAPGSPDLGERLEEILGVDINNDWGLDHGTWSVLCHMFPEADIPVSQLSVNGLAGPREVYDLGKKLTRLREEGILILGSGNIVHNLRLANWQSQGPDPENKAFDSFIAENIGDHPTLINYKENPFATYAVPTPDHFYPFLYALGASDGDKAKTFNQVGNLGSISMTSFVFTDDKIIDKLEKNLEEIN